MEPLVNRPADEGEYQCNKQRPEIGTEDKITKERGANDQKSEKGVFDSFIRDHGNTITRYMKLETSFHTPSYMILNPAVRIFMIPIHRRSKLLGILGRCGEKS